MELWHIVLIAVAVVAAGGVAYALMRKRRAPMLPKEAEPLPAPKPVLPPAGIEEPEETTEELYGIEATAVKQAPPAPPPPSGKEAEKKRKPPEPPPVKAKAAAPAPAPEKVLPIRKGLEKTRGGFISRLKQLIGGKKEVDPELLQQVEELFLTSDIGVKTTETFIKLLRDNLSARELSDPREVWGFIREEARKILSVRFNEPALAPGEVYALMVVGVNGAGKTTTIGKMASRYQAAGRKVVMAAADTFRAAAVAQLEIWGRRGGCEVIKGRDGADPSSVIFDAMEKARGGLGDVVIADTAGRLHTKLPLMEELKKDKRVMAKAQPGAPHEILLVLDATTGQNGVLQAKTFLESLEVTGIVLTKLDGTAKGGVILSICNEMNIPVRYIGIGEGVDDLKVFNPDEFVAALFDEVADKEAAA